MTIIAASRKYRSADQWRKLIQQWQSSGLSAKSFCQQHDLGYASFCQWRQRLNPAELDSPAQANDFIDVSNFPLPKDKPAVSFNLRLGHWLELSINR